MTGTTSTNPQWTPLLANPLELAQTATSYSIDAWQRTLLYADVRRQRGDQYSAHLAEQVPNVLSFPSEPVMSGLDLPRPVNYGMVRILPTADQPVDNEKRPFVVIDPRAGHGPGIGGFKPDSEVGAAMKAGHPCYFVGFLPDPVPGQTIEDVMRAQAEFVRRAGELHPDSRGKPAVIGNCQAGWQVLMAASLWPELFGPIIVAGAPLSYWAGDNPMRYAGGLLGGSWMTALTSDVGAGRFDGAWLVQNFESLDPANTWWSKPYNLYSKVDTEAPRYLGFEKYWGGYVFLNDVEMQYIVDNLFIGNKLATAELVTADGLRIDLRNIRSPILVFSSYGDNITPPAQALGWITDLYRDDADVLGHNQTIVYATHDSIGHLGIFVSGSVGRKEHTEFAASIDIIDLLPVGIYRADVEGVPEAEPNGVLDDEHTMRIQRSSVDEVRAIVKPDPESERRFAAAAQSSQINLGLYRNVLQPWVRAFSTPYTAQWLQTMHPLRVSYEWWSSKHPLAPALEQAAQQVREQRRPVDADNPFLRAQKELSDAVEQALDRFRDHRDQIYAGVFNMLYGSPWAKALAGQVDVDDKPGRAHPGDSPEHRAFIERELAQLPARMLQGGVLEAGTRAVFYVLRNRSEVDTRRYRYASQLQQDTSLVENLDMTALRHLVRSQAMLMTLDMDSAITAIPGLLADTPASDIRAQMRRVEQAVRSGSDQLTSDEVASLKQVLALFDAPASQRETSTLKTDAAESPEAASPKAPATGTKPRSTRATAARSAKPASSAKTSADPGSTSAPAGPAKPKPKPANRKEPS
ncbi:MULTISPECIES: DUF3141 domain-containing protein [Pseudomonas]|uniref:DUF3141 domain-containing protein n=1 Tax=Pseudomonas helleri TaxID=1608996 RepID=A0A6L5HTQ3_9PSED|nr:MULTISPECIES: DUF3141 domain-containing protein [Pseudomonas]MQT47883.1 DUF3141 domain-containing protein [Pseudomonas helleri]MQT59186.1 DUF3141 domain-containing protein [Pseudomonas sp. FSL R10-0399]MQT88748.1 DUF3141 domain-containing protein [Pseudomonas helleri]MQU06438.1 DUF3141 domain-containing protein [Pseudomonas helleri]